MAHNAIATDPTQTDFEPLKPHQWYQSRRAAAATVERAESQMNSAKYVV